MEPVVVRVRDGDCPCPGTPHEFEEVALEPALTVSMGAAALYAIKLAGASQPEQMAALTAAYLPLGIRKWSFLDEKGEELAHTSENLETLIPWEKGGLAVVEQADSLYSGSLMAPLVARMRASSPTGQTEKKTSLTSPSGLRHPARSGRSSQNGTAGKPSEAPVP